MSQNVPVVISLKNPCRSGTVGDASENRNASDSCDAGDIRLGSSGTDWDTISGRAHISQESAIRKVSDFCYCYSI